MVRVPECVKRRARVWTRAAGRGGWWYDGEREGSDAPACFMRAPSRKRATWTLSERRVFFARLCSYEGDVMRTQSAVSPRLAS